MSERKASRGTALEEKRRWKEVMTNVLSWNKREGASKSKRNPYWSQGCSIRGGKPPRGIDRYNINKRVGKP